MLTEVLCSQCVSCGDGGVLSVTIIYHIRWIGVADVAAIINTEERT